MAESYKRGLNAQSAGNLPKLRPGSRPQGELISDRNRLMHISDELADLDGQRALLQQKIKRLGELEAVEHAEYQALVAMRRQRRDLEQQSQVVSNRIEHLKNLKDDLWKRIRYMHTCAAEIEALKMKNESRKREKEAAKLAAEKQRLEKTSQEGKGKDSTKINLSRRKELMEFQKKEQAEKLRKQKEANEKKYQAMKRQQHRENELKRKQVHTAEMYCTQFKELFVKQKREKVLNRLVEDKKKEKFIIKKFQKDIDSLRRKEDEWMAQVRETEKMFFKANDRLKKVMNIEDDQQEGKEDFDESMNVHDEDLPNDDEDDHDELDKNKNLHGDRKSSHRELSGTPISVE